MDHLQAFSERIETVFRHIAQTRMEGVPVVNPKLGVSMRGLRRFGEHHAGVLVTPWFMNLLFFPMEQPDEPRRVGSKSDIALPSGIYDAIWSHEEALGGYWSVSLFSPMAEFDEMDVAVETADATLDLLFSVPEEAEEEDFGEAMVQPGAGRDVEARLAEPEAEPADQYEEDDEPEGPQEMDRRALFGLRRKEEGEPA